MRLWTLHPQYLDARGLVALWREGLLAQAVLSGRTRGYTRHPQLLRFRGTPAPVEAIAFYLHGVQAEANRRGYLFNGKKIAVFGHVAPIAVTYGQLAFEWRHLEAKLRARAPAWLARVRPAAYPAVHPLFRLSRDARAPCEGRAP